MNLPKLLFILLLLLAVTACGDKTPALKNGQAAPAFSLADLQGSKVTFPDDFRGKVVAIRFWADWCPFCKTEMKDLEPAYRKLKEKGLVMLAVNVRQDRDTAAQFIKKLGVSYDVLLDTEGEVAKRYGVLGLPTTFFVDRHGILSSRIIGESTPDDFTAIISELLPQ